MDMQQKFVKEFPNKNWSVIYNRNSCWSSLVNWYSQLKSMCWKPYISVVYV